MTIPFDLPAIPQELVGSAAELAAVCDHLRHQNCFAFDTEFIGENTYEPILCLVQVATTERVELIDPFAVGRAAMAPLWDLLADPAIEKICHAGDQDVEIAWLHSGHVTTNMFDTQIGAGMLGIAYPTALWRVVEFFTGTTLEKAHTYSAWDRRPLSKAQFQYAIDDVRYLPGIHAEMKRRIADLGHADWMRAACDEMCAYASSPHDARNLYVKIRGAAGLHSDQLSVLREVTVLREQIAYENDVPPRTLAKDEVLLDIATRMPKKPASLNAVRDISPDFASTYGEDVLEAVERGIAAPENERPAIHIPGEDPAEVKRLAETLWVAAQVICLGQSVSPSLVTSQNEILALARIVHRKKNPDKHPLLTGWHRQCLGEKLLAFIRGELEVDITMKDELMRGTFRALADGK
jgi:ribonuclease D